MSAPRLPRWVWRWFRDDHHWEALSFFRGVPIFQGLTRRQLGRVMMAMQHRPYRAGEIVFEEGQLGRAVFITALSDRRGTFLGEDRQMI